MTACISLLPITDFHMTLPSERGRLLSRRIFVYNNGFLGTGMNFTKKEMGQLIEAITILITQYCQSSLNVEANLFKNSTITTCSTKVVPTMPRNSQLVKSPRNTFCSSSLRAFTSLKSWQRTNALNMTVLLILPASGPHSLIRCVPLNCNTSSTTT